MAEELGRRFGLPRWQFAMSATDANRFVLRFARHLTGRPRIAVMDWCYHGTVDETLAVLDGDRVVPRPGAMGPQVDVALTTAVVPFNDLEALDRRLAEGDVAALLMEPALTNIGIVLPEEGYSEAVREITRKHDVLLVIDETHTLCAGPGGCTRGLGARARPAGGRQADRRRRPAGGVRHDGRGRRPADRPDAHRRGRRVGCRRHADRQRARAGRRPRGPVVGAARGGLRRRDPARGAVHRRRRRRHREARAAVARPAPRVPRGVLVLPAAPRRRRRRGGRRRGPRGLPAPVGAQPRRAADAVPQHGAVLAGAHRGRRRPAHRGLRRGHRRAGRAEHRFVCGLP